MSEFENVCLKLDDLAIRNLELCNETVKLSVDLENRLKDGAINLAKSRYLMGYSKVSGLQIDEREMQSFAKVSIEPPNTFQLVKSDDNQKLKSLTKCFGVLTPNNVKMSQQQYVTCLELACELATVKAELKQVQLEYADCLLLKSKLTSKEE